MNFARKLEFSQCDDSEQFPTLCSRFRMGLLKLFAFLIKDLNNSLKNYLKPKNPWTNFLKIPVQDGNYLPSLTTLYVTNVGNIRPREITTIIWTELHDKRKSPRIKVKVKFSFQVQSLCLLMSLVVSQFLITGFCFFSTFNAYMTYQDIKIFSFFLSTIDFPFSEATLNPSWWITPPL